MNVVHTKHGIGLMGIRFPRGNYVSFLFCVGFGFGFTIRNPNIVSQCIELARRLWQLQLTVLAKMYIHA